PGRRGRGGRLGPGRRVAGVPQQARGAAPRGRDGHRGPGMTGSAAAARLLVVDDYDSFTYNLLQYLADVGAAVTVWRNDAFELGDVAALDPTGIVISPGPCTPAEAGLSVSVVQRYAGNVPMLGVCLGHQAIGQAFGARVVRAARLVHGKTSAVR